VIKSIFGAMVASWDRQRNELGGRFWGVCGLYDFLWTYTDLKYFVINKMLL
jgi:hypothetical protein